MALNIEYLKQRHTGRWIALIILIVVIAAAGWYGYKWYTTGDLPVDVPIASANSSVDESPVTSTEIDEYIVEPMQARYINIPSLDVQNTRIYPVGLDANNLLTAPANINDVVWYKTSGTPGNGGVLLMQGHNVGINKNGVFYKLSTLVKGDTITIQRGDGEKFVYSVVENNSMSIEQVNATGMKSMGVSAEPGKEALNLMTYDGTWVPRLGMFDRRTMVRAVLNEN